MMKKIIFMALAGAFVVAPLLAGAQGNAPTTGSPTAGQTRPLAGWDEAKKEIIKERLNRLGERLATRLGLVESLFARIQERIGQFEARNGNVALARAKAAEAQTAIAAAKTALAELKIKTETELKAVLDSQTKPKPALKNLKTLHADAVTKLKAAHRAVVETIVALKNSFAPTTPPPTDNDPNADPDDENNGGN